MATIETETAQPPQGFWRIFLSLIRRPRRTFEALRDAPSRAWLWMAALALVAALLPILVGAPISMRLAREAVQQQIETLRANSPEMTPEQEAQILDMAANPLFTMVLPAAGGALAAVLGWLVWSGALHLLSTMLGGGETFGQMWRVVIWSQIPLALRGLLQSVYIAATGNLITHPGLSGLVSGAQSAEEAVQEFLTSPPSTGQMLLQTLLSKIDLFVLWQLVLLGIGVTVTARLSGRKGALAVAITWLVLTALSLAPVLVSASMTGGFGGM